ncbi:hypothetical protein D3C72_1246850 [compost metagenome]
MALHFFIVVAEIKSTVLADDSADRPYARNHFTPTCRTTGDRNDFDSGIVKIPKRLISLWT